MRIEYAKNGTPLPTIDRWFNNPMEGLEHLVRLFDEGAELMALNAHKLAVDLFEDDANYYARFELPEVGREEIGISFEDGALTVKVEKPGEEEGAKVLKAVRTLELPAGVRSDEVSAALKDGVLTVTLPKAEEAKARMIEIS